MAEYERSHFSVAKDLGFPLFVFYRMPKEGLDKREWERRLKLFAQGKFEFGRGRAPPPGSVWAKKRAAIVKCAVGKAKIDVFGRVVECTCGYHPKTVSDIETSVLIVHYQYYFI